jgi:hypothetical protein
MVALEWSANVKAALRCDGRFFGVSGVVGAVELEKRLLIMAIKRRLKAPKTTRIDAK